MKINTEYNPTSLSSLRGRGVQKVASNINAKKKKKKWTYQKLSLETQEDKIVISDNRPLNIKDGLITE